MLINMTAPMLFDYMSIVLNKQNLADKDFKVNFKLTDLSKNYLVHFKSGVMLVYENTLSDSANMTLSCPENGLFMILQRNYDGAKKVMEVEYNAEYLTLIMDNLTEFELGENKSFNIVEP